MTNTSKGILAVILIVVVGFGIWKLAGTSSGTVVYPNGSPNQPTSSMGQTTGTASASDTSNASIAGDMNNMDTQMSGLNSDSANMNQGSDVPPAQ